LIAFNPLIDYLDNDDEIVYEPEFCCPQHYQRIVVSSDGLVLMCSNDEENMEIIGDLSTDRLYDVWHGEKLQRIRELHRQGEFNSIPVCRKCYLPRATEDSEVACVNGRMFRIQNYIGRSQQIGE